MSTVSMEEEARIQALTISVEDLTRKLREAEETLSRRMYEHEGELEDLTARLEEAKFDLAASRREEKELRAKERSGTGQIAGLEAEVARLGKALEASRASYSGLNRQYQEQCAEAERVRNQLRGRDAELKDLRDAAGLVSLETGKWGRERENYDERIVGLEADLAAAAAAHAALEDQKQENMMLKETIDRLRFEMDELRTAAAAAGSGKDAAASREATMSRSLGAEMQRMIGDEKWEDGDGDDSADTETVVGTPGPGEDEGSGSGSEDEIETQTIITRKKKVGTANSWICDSLLMCPDRKRLLGPIRSRRSGSRRRKSTATHIRSMMFHLSPRRSLRKPIRSRSS
jgi:chromosome segregation ATPase